MNIRLNEVREIRNNAPGKCVYSIGVLISCQLSIRTEFGARPAPKPTAYKELFPRWWERDHEAGLSPEF
jgi:hypothetical protein